MAFLGPSHHHAHAHAGGGFAHGRPLQQPGSPWGSGSFDSSSSAIDMQLSYEESSSLRQQHSRSMEPGGPFKMAPGPPYPPETHSRLGNLHYSSALNRSFHPAAAPGHAGGFTGKLSPLGPHQGAGPALYSQDSFGSSSDFRSTCSSQQHQAWDDPMGRTHSPFRASLISSIRAQELLRDTGSGNSSPLGGGCGGGSSSFSSSSPRGMNDFRAKRHSGSATGGGSSPRTPPHGAGGHRVGIDPRLVVGSPLEVAWEVLQHNPQLAGLLSLQPHTAKLHNLAVQQDEEGQEQDPDQEQEQGSGDLGDVLDAAAAAAAAGGCREADLPLVPEQLLREQGLVRSCRGLPARVRDDLIKAARLAVTRRDSSGSEQRGTGLLPFFWRVQSNLKWLLQQPATLKGQLLPGQIDFITEEQRGLSFQKTVQQRMRLGELAVMLQNMLLAPEEPAAPSPQGDSAASKAL